MILILQSHSFDCRYLQKHFSIIFFFCNWSHFSTHFIYIVIHLKWSMQQLRINVHLIVYRSFYCLYSSFTIHFFVNINKSVKWEMQWQNANVARNNFFFFRTFLFIFKKSHQSHSDIKTEREAIKGNLATNNDGRRSNLSLIVKNNCWYLIDVARTWNES